MKLYNSAAVAILRWKAMTREYGSSAMVWARNAVLQMTNMYKYHQTCTKW